MTVLGVSYVSVLVRSIEAALPTFDALGLRLAARELHRGLAAHSAILATDDGALVLMEPTDDRSRLAERLRAHGGGLYHVALLVDSLDGYATLPGAELCDGLVGQGLLVELPSTRTLLEIVTEPWQRAARAGPLSRIESIPWAVKRADEVAADLLRLLGLQQSEPFSDLWFPDLGVRNRLLFAGPRCYLDLNQPDNDESPMARHLARFGDGIFAVVIEPHDLDQVGADLHQRGVPLLATQPVDLRVQWRDGTHGIAARVLAVNRHFTHGARIFFSAPTFPW